MLGFLLVFFAWIVSQLIPSNGKGSVKILSQKKSHPAENGLTHIAAKRLITLLFINKLRSVEKRNIDNRGFAIF